MYYQPEHTGAALRLASHLYSKLEKLKPGRTAAIGTSFGLYGLNQTVMLLLTSIELTGLKHAIRQLGSEDDKARVTRLSATLLSLMVISSACSAANVSLTINNYLKSAKQDLEHRRRLRGFKRNARSAILAKVLALTITTCREVLQAGMTLASYRYLNEVLADAFPQQLHFLKTNIFAHLIVPGVVTGLGNLSNAVYVTKRYCDYTLEELAYGYQQASGNINLAKAFNKSSLFIFASMAFYTLIYSFGYLLDLIELGEQTHGQQSTVGKTFAQVFFWLGAISAVIAGLSDAVISTWHIRDMSFNLKNWRLSCQYILGSLLGLLGGGLGLLAGPAGVYKILEDVNQIAGWVCAGMTLASDLLPFAAFECGNGVELIQEVTQTLKNWQGESSLQIEEISAESETTSLVIN